MDQTPVQTPGFTSAPTAESLHPAPEEQRLAKILLEPQTPAPIERDAQSQPKCTGGGAQPWPRPLNILATYYTMGILESERRNAGPGRYFG